jgi:hypothetical protein
MLAFLLVLLFYLVRLSLSVSRHRLHHSRKLHKPMRIAFRARPKPPGYDAKSSASKSSCEKPARVTEKLSIDVYLQETPAYSRQNPSTLIRKHRYQIEVERRRIKTINPSAYRRTRLGLISPELTWSESHPSRHLSTRRAAQGSRRPEQIELDTDLETHPGHSALRQAASSERIANRSSLRRCFVAALPLASVTRGSTSTALAERQSGRSWDVKGNGPAPRLTAPAPTLRLGIPLL